MRWRISRLVLGWMVGLGSLVSVRVAVAQQSDTSTAMVGYTAADAVVERALEEDATTHPSPDSARDESRTLSREPHMAGTPVQEVTRDYVLSRMRAWGLQTEVRAYDVYIPHPLGEHIWQCDSAGDSTELALAEGPIAGDSTSSAYPQIPTFNAYSAVGSGTGPVVYVNYGLIQDYAYLDSIGVSVAGKVVVARYGHSFRGIKAREAEKHGAAALLIYSDPADDGYVRGDVYPDGPMRPDRGVQRGSIMNDNGDPSTPGYPSLPGVPRLTPAQMSLPRIPVIPISAHNASLLLGAIRGHTPMPQSWQGGLPFRYHIGPGPTRARVSFDAEEGAAAYHTIWDTFGIVRGSTYPDQIVMIGAHRDAWGPGAADNVSGVVSVLEAARAVAAEARAGHRPKRTIIFATWDAEEWGLVGSTEYVEQDSLRLRQHAVAYFNQDVVAQGPMFTATGSPSLREVLRSVTSEIPNPGVAASPSVYAAWRLAASPTSDTSKPPIGGPGGGSDFAGFANHLGIPIIEWGFSGPAGVYHSAYDDFEWMSRYGDPGFLRHVAAARVGIAVLLRFANADVLPYDYDEYANTMQGHLAPLTASLKSQNISTSRLSGAIDSMENAAHIFNAARSAVLSSAKKTARGWGQVNDTLLAVERAITRPAGLVGRPWFRSLAYASDIDDGYASMALPSLGEAMRLHKDAQVEYEIGDLASRFLAAAAVLRNATQVLLRAH